MMMGKRLLFLLMVTLVLASCGLLRQGTEGSATSTPQATVAASQEPTPTPTPDAQALQRALHEPGWAERLEAVGALREREDIPLDERVGLLAEGLQQELEAPSQGEAPGGAYLSAHGVMRIQFTHGLVELGPEALPELRENWEGAEGEARQHLTLALVYLGERDAIPQARELLRTSPVPELRMDAARALGTIKAEEAIPDLVQALQDPYGVTVTTSIGERTIYPVREQATGALVKLGVTVERIGEHDFQVEGQ